MNKIKYSEERDAETGYGYFDARSKVDRIITRHYEGGNVPLLATAETFMYDSLHNVVRYTDEGDTAIAGDGLYATMTYVGGLPRNLIGLRSEVKIYATGASGGSWLRRTLYEHDTATGALTRQSLLNGSLASHHDFTYDAYGNLASATLPHNSLSQRLSYSYTYDPYLHTYPVSIDNSYGDTSRSIYDMRRGKPLLVTDPGGSVMRYAYDPAGRLASVTSPLSASGTPNIIVDYYPLHYYGTGAPSPRPPSQHPYAVTSHYDDHGHIVTRSVVICDASGRVLQTKKGMTSGGLYGYQVSGRLFIDPLGRAVRSHDPVFVPDTNSPGDFVSAFTTLSRTSTAYDILDRVRRVTTPLGHVTATQYGVATDAGNRNRHSVTVTDPDGNITLLLSDYEGRTVQTTDALGGVTVTTYNPLGQPLSSTDPEGFTTTYSYDKLGRLILRDHPDAGPTGFSYDRAGNLVSETRPLGSISYTYNYKRLTKKHYSDKPNNDVTYTYGTLGASTGRIVKVTDGTGMRLFTHDALGNVVTDERRMALPGSLKTVNLSMRYTYDSWGRLLSLTYPDNEVLSYRYLFGGDLYGIAGQKGAETHTYISDITYNDFGQRTRVVYGNDTKAYYDYDIEHRLVHLRSTSSAGTMQDIQYTFDPVGNIQRVQGGAAPVSGLGGPYTDRHRYDPLHRLTESNGLNGAYSLAMDYSPSGRLWSRLRSGTLATPSTEEAFFAYCKHDKPHAPRRILDQNNHVWHDLRWDDAGNLGQVSSTMNELCETSRFLLWNSDNRLHTVCDGKCYSYYAYDHEGERTLKLTGSSNVNDINADAMNVSAILDQLTLYPSPFMVLTGKGYTKHYYAGSDRICARPGGGGLPIATADSSLTATADSLFQACLQDGAQRSLSANDLTCLATNGSNDLPVDIEIHEIPAHLLADIQVYLTSFEAMLVHNSVVHDSENEAYFYHADHLGSASWVTDDGGHPVQHLRYMPFGEPLVNQRAAGSTYEERFTFTAKERDPETGYGYFGARYYDPDISALWLSVDPMADKYPGISPYAYCAWNPVKLVDPDGRDVWEVSEDGHVTKNSDEGGKKKQTIIYANGSTATLRGSQYHTVMSDLEDKKGESNSISSSYGNENMQSAYANIFKSMADNTNVEWIMERYSDNHYAIGTMHSETESPTSSELTRGKQNDKSLVAIIHSHPMVNGYDDPTSTASQVSSMGYCFSKGFKAGDAYYKAKKVPHVNYYTYFPRTKQLWSVGINRPAFIRNISSASDFFFGTYNTR